MRYAPAAWSREGNNVVLRLNEPRKLKRDVPDWLMASGSSGNALIFEATDLEEFLGELPAERNSSSGFFARLLGRTK